LPVVDCLRVIASRLIAGRSPLKGGKDHFHHLLAEIFGRKRAFYVYVSSILATSTLAILVPTSGIYLIVAMTAMCLGFVASKRVLSNRMGFTERKKMPRRTAGQIEPATQLRREEAG
jgi:UDP-N-acetylmuramyl pentapeptide phosphotransferase/UDP-N-acetylglucosamine-1-phosphate transferase